MSVVFKTAKIGPILRSYLFCAIKLSFIILVVVS